MIYHYIMLQKIYIGSAELLLSLKKPPIIILEAFVIDNIFSAQFLHFFYAAWIMRFACW